MQEGGKSNIRRDWMNFSCSFRQTKSTNYNCEKEIDCKNNLTPKFNLGREE